MLGEPPGERLLAARAILARIRPRAIWASTFGSRSPGDQRGHHLPAGDPEDVGGHHRQLDLGVFQQLLHPLLLRGPASATRSTR